MRSDFRNHSPTYTDIEETETFLQSPSLPVMHSRSLSRKRYDKTAKPLVFTAGLTGLVIGVLLAYALNLSFHIIPSHYPSNVLPESWSTFFVSMVLNCDRISNNVGLSSAIEADLLKTSNLRRSPIFCIKRRLGRTNTEYVCPFAKLC